MSNNSISIQMRGASFTTRNLPLNARLPFLYEGWIVPKGGCVLGGDGLVGGGGGVYLVAAA